MEIRAVRVFGGCFRLRIYLSIVPTDLSENTMGNEISTVLCDFKFPLLPWVGIWDCLGWGNAWHLFRNRELWQAQHRPQNPLCSSVFEKCGSGDTIKNVMQRAVFRGVCTQFVLRLYADNLHPKQLCHTTFRLCLYFCACTRKIATLFAHKQIQNHSRRNCRVCGDLSYKSAYSATRASVRTFRKKTHRSSRYLFFCLVLTSV